MRIASDLLRNDDIPFESIAERMIDWVVKHRIAPARGKTPEELCTENGTDRQRWFIPRRGEKRHILVRESNQMVVIITNWFSLIILSGACYLASVPDDISVIVIETEVSTVGSNKRPRSEVCYFFLFGWSNLLISLFPPKEHINDETTVSSEGEDSKEEDDLANLSHPVFTHTPLFCENFIFSFCITDNGGRSGN